MGQQKVFPLDKLANWQTGHSISQIFLSKLIKLSHSLDYDQQMQMLPNE